MNANGFARQSKSVAHVKAITRKFLVKDVLQVGRQLLLPKTARRNGQRGERAAEQKYALN